MIIISDLHSSSGESLLTEVTAWEMRTIEGGRRRRRSRTEEVDTSNILSTENMEETVAAWLTRLDQQIVDLRLQLGGAQS
ncbi:hypothetical protein [Nostoc sp. NZL]|uniref:hypothetical protein n=1 Tax=Nostoc sp. NZL TaxID=2650612 RepID=UPI0018C49BA0|nr:hypothetical protein [Nostoc sp. NZL]MBG1239915.1 hypothetical protein [Nostoc sp. NZL]